ncbi:MAG: hypothetical protein SGBAC_009043 [Bacillariaceae sp.]
MGIPLTIEATDAIISSSVSLITLESVLSDSSIRFNHEKKFGRRMSQGPVVQPRRKPSSKELLFLFEDEDPSHAYGKLHNATFPEDDTRSKSNSLKVTRLASVLGSDASYSSSTSIQSRSPHSKDHLLERFMTLVEDAKKAPQKPSRRPSQRRMTASSMPLSMPVRKASVPELHGFQGRRRDSV